jgi:hypothetical protein
LINQNQAVPFGPHDWTCSTVIVAKNTVVYTSTHTTTYDQSDSWPIHGRNAGAADIKAVNYKFLGQIGS